MPVDHVTVWIAFIFWQFFKCPHRGGIALLEDRIASPAQRRTLNKCNYFKNNTPGTRCSYVPWMKLLNQQYPKNMWYAAKFCVNKRHSTSQRHPIRQLNRCVKDVVIVPDGRRLSERSPWQMWSRLWSSAFGPAPPPETESLINTDGSRLALALPPPRPSRWISSVSSTIMSACAWRLTNDNLLCNDKGTSGPKVVCMAAPRWQKAKWVTTAPSAGPLRRDKSIRDI